MIPVFFLRAIYAYLVISAYDFAIETCLLLIFDYMINLQFSKIQLVFFFFFFHGGGGASLETKTKN